MVLFERSERFTSFVKKDGVGELDQRPQGERGRSKNSRAGERATCNSSVVSIRRK